MGRGGADVAREAADTVLADDDFVSIYAAVEEGRVAVDNLRKVTFVLVSTEAAEVIIILTALSAGWLLPLLAAQTSPPNGDRRGFVPMLHSRDNGVTSRD